MNWITIEFMPKHTIFKISFFSQQKVYELFAKEVISSHLYGFTEIRDIVFEDAERLVLDPAEEKLREEFKDTSILHIPLQNIIRIEEVEKRGKSRVRSSDDYNNITPFPLPSR